MLKVHHTQRYLSIDGKPFYWLGDTAWHLFHRLTFDEAVRYLNDRAAKGFTVIQAVILCEYDGFKPNVNGDVIFDAMDVSKPNSAYFKHIDRVMDAAAKLGLYMALIPVWGDKVGTGFWGEGPTHFINEQNARDYGKFIGARYRDYPVIWMNGGDRPADGNEHIWNALAEGLKEGDKDTHLMTYHPCGGRSSSEWFHNTDWLDFNMLQTAHQIHANTYTPIAVDYSRTPAKPCIVGECGYEDHPSAGGEIYIDDYYVRMGAYWSVFSGAFGNTYGCHDIWQFYDPKRYKPINRVRTPWYDALDFPGASQMAHLKSLMLSHPFFERIPDQSIIGDNQKASGLPHVRATRDGTKGKSDASYIMAYFAAPASVGIRTNVIASKKIRCRWYDPRNGTYRDAGVIDNSGEPMFSPPSTWRETDWVLVLDKANGQ
ncbi:MAG: glycoside hydrolase family 140 protein [Spirochaetes bacterium]|nr:glycoside hydrolase family 140 protein [Spirochaetota bacterium]